MSRYTADVVFCDLIRQENTGKFLLVGTYVDTLVPGRFPCPITLALWIRLWGVSAGVHKLRIRIRSDEGLENVVEAEMHLADSQRPGAISVNGVPFTLNRPGAINVFIAVDGDEEFDAGTLTISKAGMPAPTLQ